MKRRDFLAASALFSLFTGDALAAKKKTQKKTTAKKTSRKSSKKKSPRSARSNLTGTSRPAVHSAATPLIDASPEGTSTSRLPPVRAQEAPSDWQTYEIVTTLNLRAPGQNANLWLPLPSTQDNLHQRLLGHNWQTDARNVSLQRKPEGELEVLRCEWNDASNASLRLVTQVSTADRHFDITRRSVPPERDDILRHNLQASTLIPNDGLARQLGERIVGRIKDPLAQVKAIYDWICENAIYDPSLPGCGNGEIHRQLISGQYGGRSADINGLFVAVCRSIGIPARCVYGIRIGRSRLFPSLGLRSDDATRAQHVRAEFYLPGYGWIPTDPSDVRRAVAYEALQDGSGQLASLRRVLFGVWEMNWAGFHSGNDLQLTGLSHTLPHFILPQLRVGAQNIDVLNPNNTSIRISARQIVL